MPGSAPPISPSSPTFGTLSPAIITIAVTTTIATSGEGTAFVKRGSTTTITTVSTNSG